MEFQMIADEGEDGMYEFDIIDTKMPWRISFEQGLRQIIDDIQNGVRTSKISGKFHNTIAEIIYQVVRRISYSTGLKKVALSGGVFQNALLVEKVITRFRRTNIQILFHSKVPPNDGGISLGQAVVALNCASS
jgi:hydrogenase maturation protein HypF